MFQQGEKNVILSVGEGSRMACPGGILLFTQDDSFER